MKIRVENLTKYYDSILALDRLSLAVPEGSIFGLVGPNGSGKSTFLKLLMGFLFADSGLIDLGSLSRTEIGYSPDRAFLPVRFRAVEFLTVAGQLSGLTGSVLKQSVAFRLEQVGLGDVARTRIGALSKGMFQRLSLAAALVHNPSLLLLDEPMSGLDPGQQAMLRDVIRGSQAEGKTILMSTHRLSDVANLCTHVAILKQGRLVRAGPLAAVLSPQHRVLITVDRLPAELAAWLGANYQGVASADRTIALAEEAIGAKSAILRVLLDAGCDIEQITQQRATLDEVYLQAVQS